MRVHGDLESFSADDWMSCFRLTTEPNGAVATALKSVKL